MGKSKTPKYVISVTGLDQIFPRFWNSKEMGKPTSENIEKMVYGYIRSCETGINRVIGDALGRSIHMPTRVSVRCQTGKHTGEIVAIWVSPMFTVI